MWVNDVINWIKDFWANDLKEFFIYGAIVLAFVLSGFIRRLYHSVKNAILSLGTAEGFVSFLLAAGAMLLFLNKLGIIKW